MPIQSIILCDRVTHLRVNDDQSVLLFKSDRIHSCLYATPDPVNANIIVSVSSHPFENEEFHIDLFRFESHTKEWVEVHGFQKPRLKTNPKDIPYFFDFPVKLSLKFPGMYLIRAMGFLETLSTLDDHPDSVIDFKFPVWDIGNESSHNDSDTSSN